MKKLFAILLAIILCVSFAACGAPKTLDGTYKSASIFFDDTYQLNENGTFDKSPSTKGTYESTAKGMILTEKDSYEMTYIESGDYYYHETTLYCFDEDEEYGLTLTVDENGTTDQHFEQVCGDLSNRTHFYDLVLKKDKTFSARYERTNHLGGWNVDTEAVEEMEGTYRFEDDVLYLTHNGTETPMFLVDGKLYFDVIQKVE